MLKPIKIYTILIMTILILLPSSVSFAAVNSQTCSSGGSYTARSGDILLELDPGNMPFSGCWPLGTGIPLKRSQITSTANLAVAGKNQGKVSANFEVRNTWDDGSIKWLWIDFLAEKDEEYYLITNDSPGPTPSPGITATEDENSIQVNTGAVTMRWSKDGATPIEIIQGGQTIATSQGDGVYVINQNGIRAALKGIAAELDWRVETNNSVRAVIRVEGWYVTEAGDQLARAIVRYHLYAGQPWAKVDHTFVITNETNETWFQEVGLDFPLQNGSDAIFEKGSGDLATANLSSGQEAYVFQEKYPHFHFRDSQYTIKNGSQELDSGAVAKGWSALESANNGAILAVKEFAPQYPKELTVTSGKLTAKLWSNRGGWNLDYKSSTLLDSYWGEDWFNQMQYGRDASTLASHGFNGANTVRGHNFSALGTARTHELMLGYYDGSAQRSQAQGWVGVLETSPIVYPDPAWTVERGQVMWPVAVKGEAGSEYEDLEKFIKEWPDVYLLPERELWTHSSWYDWGRMPVLDYQYRNGKIFAGWFRLNLESMYGIGKNMWWAWARSGDRRYLDTLQKLDRKLSDDGIFHWSGSEYYRKQGSLNWGEGQFPILWARSGTLQMYMSHRLAPLSYEYLFRDSRWILDALELTKEKHIENFTPDYHTTQCGEADVINNLMSLYRVFGEPFGDMAKELFENATDPNKSYGLSEDFYGATSYCSSITHHERYRAEALVEFYEMFADEYAAAGNNYARRVAERAARDICLGSYDNMPVGYTETRIAMCTRLYEWTGDEAALEPMFLHLNSLRDMISMFNALPPEERGAEHFIDKAGDYYSGEMSYSFPACRFNTWQYRDYTTKSPGSLSFDSSSNASVLQTLPTVLKILPQVEHLNTGESRCRFLEITKPDGSMENSGSYDIEYSLYNAQYNSYTEVDFYYDTDSSGFDGTAIAECQNKPKGENLICTWDTSELPDGDYWVYGRLYHDEGNSYSAGKLTIGSGNPADVNSDGSVNSQDITLCVNVILEIEKDPAIVARAKAVVPDLNVCNAQDLTAIVNEILK